MLRSFLVSTPVCHETTKSSNTDRYEKIERGETTGEENKV